MSLIVTDVAESYEIGLDIRTTGGVMNDMVKFETSRILGLPLRACPTTVLTDEPVALKNRPPHRIWDVAIVHLSLPLVLQDVHSHREIWTACISRHDSPALLSTELARASSPLGPTLGNVHQLFAAYSSAHIRSKVPQ
jgi:hypothetical protein